MEEFDTSDLAWILYKLFYGIDNDKTIVKNKERSYMEIVFGNKSINMSGDTDIILDLDGHIPLEKI